MSKIRVGIIGMQIGRSWGAVAHMPALEALDDFEVTAVSTTRMESAKAAAAHFGILNAYDNHEDLVSSPDVDLVVVTVKVPHHHALVAAAIGAGKHVYCEWPLGNGLAEARDMAAYARSAGVTAVVGLQARYAPPIVYARDLIQQGAIGEVLSTSLVGNGLGWSRYVDSPNAYLLDASNGATLLSIPAGHTLDAVCWLLGEVRDVSARFARRITSSLNVDTNEQVASDVPDQVLLSATLESDVVASLHYRGGMSQGPGFDWRIIGTKGELRFTADNGHAQMSDLSLEGAFEDDAERKSLTIPPGYYHTHIKTGPATNVAELYHHLGAALKNGTACSPSFDDAVIRHEMLQAVEASASAGSAVMSPRRQ